MDENYLFLTTYGRKTGKPYTVELSFFLESGKIYLLAHSRENGLGTGWYRNLKVNPTCKLDIGGKKFEAKADFTSHSGNLAHFVREKFIEKYGTEFYIAWYKDTGRLPVVLEIVN